MAGMCSHLIQHRNPDSENLSALSGPLKEQLAQAICYILSWGLVRGLLAFSASPGSTCYRGSILK